MTKPSVNTSSDEVLEGWRQKAWLQRMFLPGDFLDQVTAVGAESMVCRKTTMEYLLMNDKIEDKVFQTSKARKYSTDLDYRPQGFKKETLKILADAQTVGCGGCSGRGKVTCSRCSGQGEVSCDTTKDCDSCSGSGKIQAKCRPCGGTGKVVTGSGLRGVPIEGRCTSCSFGTQEVHCNLCVGGGRVTCDRCGGTGRRGCDRCNRSGRVTCDQCGGSGRMVHGKLITRKFSCSTERSYQLTGLAADEFKNGLAAKHFKSMPGDLALEEFQTPATDDVVHQRQSVHTYDVLSHHYTYRDAPFSLNRITSGSASKYVASGVPWSKTKTTVAGAAFFAAALAVAAVVILL